jgi:hypothetical protein
MTTTTLASGAPGSFIFNTAVGGALGAILQVIGWIILIGGFYRSYVAFNAPPGQHGGGTAKAVRTIIVSLALAAMFWFPSLIGTAVTDVSNIIGGNALPTVSQIANAPSSTTPCPAGVVTAGCSAG